MADESRTKRGIQKTEVTERGMKKSETDATQIRIYGVPIEEMHDPRLGPILEGQEDYPYIGIVYCGFKAGDNEIRLPSDRLWYFQKSAVEATGLLQDFAWEGKRVHYYTLALTAEVHEKIFRPVRLGAEITTKPGTFAAKVAVGVEGKILPEGLKELTPEQHEARVARLIQARAMGFPPIMEEEEGECKTWYQTYTSTRYDPFVRRDPWGADCDS